MCVHASMYVTKPQEPDPRLTSEGVGVDGGDVRLADPQPDERLAPEDVGRERLQGRVAVEGHHLEVVEPRVAHVRLRDFFTLVILNCRHSAGAHVVGKRKDRVI